MKEFEGQEFANRSRLVSTTREVSLDNSLDASRLKIRPGKGARVQQHLAYVIA